jgi:class 3 adenylate cyclase/tetratricopeptide (TPR) repeat protein
MAACPTCGTENRPGRKFCVGCGQPVSAACPRCGSLFQPGEWFCGECGTPNPGAGLGAGVATVPRSAGQGASPAAAPVAERRLVSVLFADLVGFTTLAEGRDPEETRELLSRYFDLAREIAERYAGTIEKFIGDAVMAVWGAPTAQEDDAERAVRAALELVAAVGTLGPGLQARASVLTGEAAVTIGASGQGMVAGDLVNTASRLQSAAAPGTVLVGDATRRAAGAAIAFEPAGEQSLKGKAAPVTAFRALRVVAERGGRGRSEALEAPFVGRDDELRLLKDLFHATSREGRARLVSVIGPAGIGKTRLAWEFLKYIDGLLEPVWWHEGRSPAYGEGISFWALGEMVRARCGLHETDEESVVRSKVAETVREHVPDETERRWIEAAMLALLGLGDGTIATAELFGAWRTFFERLSNTGTVALVFEDFNNADAGLIDFVDSLLEWSRTRPIYVLTLARPELLERRPDWHAKRNFASITLEPLPPPAMHELLSGLVPGLPESAIRSIVARADGVPLYAVETVRMLLAGGRLELCDGVYVPVGDLAELAVPDTLTALISSRIDALDPLDRALVHDAAVLGQSFITAGLSAVSGTSESDLEVHLETLVRREILARRLDPRSPDRGQLSFVQALVREVAYNTLSHADRKARHLAAARYFESLGTDELAGAVAGHYLAAWQNASGPDAAELAAMTRCALAAAAARAAALGSYEQAAKFAGQALSVTTDPAERAALLEQAGDAWSNAAHFETAATNLREAIELNRQRGDRPATAHAIAQLGACLCAGFRSAEASAIVEPAVAEFQDLEREVIELRVVYARALMLGDDNDRAIMMADSALPTAERLELLPLIARALHAKGASLLALGRTYEGLGATRSGIELAETIGDMVQVLTGRIALQAAMGSREPALAVEIGRAGLAEARRLGLRSRAISFVGNLAEGALWTGDWDAALVDLGAVLDGDLDDSQRAWLLAQDLALRAWRGEEVSAALETLRSLAAGLRDEELLPDLESRRALAEGRLTDARAAAHECSRVSALNAPAALPIAARAAVWLRDPAAVAEDVAALDATGVHGSAVRLRRNALVGGIAALEGRTVEARRQLDAARHELIDRGVAFDAALVAIDMATVLGPDDAAAIAAAAEARPLLERMGAKPFLARLDREMARG